jgi:PST family polysaccharide transporter
MSFRKAVSFGALQTFASLIVGFAAVKITSFYLGPSGVAIMGQLQYFMGMVSGGVMNGLRNGLVRRTAELANDPDRRAIHVSSVLKIIVSVGLPVSLSIIFLSGWLAQELLHQRERWTSVAVFGASYVPGLLGALMVACAVGAKSYKTSAAVNITNATINVTLFALLCPPFGVYGALIAVAIMPLVNLLVVWQFARRSLWWPKGVWGREFHMPEARRAIAFIPAATITSIGSPLIHILLRDDLAARSGIDAVGLLHGITRLSDMGASVLWGLFGLYFAPRFAELKTRQAVKHELGRAMLLFMPALIGVSVLIYLFRDTLIPIIFTKEFAAMRDLFAWQLCGTCLRIFGGTFGLVMMAKANPLLIGAYEAFTLLLWLFLGKMLIEINGAVGATQAFALNHAIYSVIVMIGAFVVIRRLPSR